MIDRDELLERFAAFPARLAEATRAGLERPVSSGEWTPAQVVSHLIAVEEVVWRRRLRDLETTEDPRWSRTEPGLATGLDDATLDEVVATFRAARAATVEVVLALGDDEWARAGVHETYGRLDIAGLLRIANEHDAEHLGSLAAD